MLETSSDDLVIINCPLGKDANSLHEFASDDSLFGPPFILWNFFCSELCETRMYIHVLVTRLGVSWFNCVILLSTLHVCRIDIQGRLLPAAVVHSYMDILGVNDVSVY